jgi:hypothetical protein
MMAETPDRDDDQARRDETATERASDGERVRDQSRGPSGTGPTGTEPPADEPPESPSEHHDDSEESGGPLGNPRVDEESLRKQQEESSERSG